MANLTLCRQNIGCKQPLKRLAAFDFDLTIVEKNTDTEIVSLLPTEIFTAELKQTYKTHGWTVYMQEIFNLANSINIKECKIKKRICQIPEINGITNLFKFLKRNNYDIIIISDSNSYFIHTWLRHNKLDEDIDAVFTNPATFIEGGLLKIEPYEYQTECKLSAVNICKGNVLDKFVQTQRSKNINYSQIMYVGDGSNDYCPMLRLSKQDIAFPRAGFSCIRKIQEDSEHIVKSKVVLWNDAYDILNEIQIDS